MLEAVGHYNLPVFFNAVSRALKPGGLAALQVITLPDSRYEAYCNQHSDFIRSYIFPGGHLPSLGAMVGISSRLGLELHGCTDVGEDYAVTLRLWRERMLANASKIRALGYPARFIRMYEFYFIYCEAVFANQLIHDYQLTWRKSPFAAPPAAAEDAPAAAEDAAGGAEQQPLPPLDMLTGVLLAIWCGLTLLLVRARSQMGAIPLAIGATILCVLLGYTFCITLLIMTFQMLTQQAHQFADGSFLREQGEAFCALLLTVNVIVANMLYKVVRGKESSRYKSYSIQRV